MSPVVFTAINKKGGCGKTTATLSLALIAAREGKGEVAVVDYDPQLSAYNHIRTAKLPLIPCQSLTDVPKTVPYVFVDTPGLDLDSTRRAASMASVLIIPCRAALFDLRASALTVQFALKAQSDRVKARKPVMPACWLPSMIDRRHAAHRSINITLQDMMVRSKYEFPILPALGVLAGQADFLNGEPGGKFEEQCVAVWAALKEIAA